MIVLIIIFGLLILYYLWLVNKIRQALTKENELTLADQSQFNKISIIIPFRNESDSLNKTLSSLEKLSYNKADFEVIFVNDHSEDEYEQFFKGLDEGNFRLIHNKGEGKKSAINTAIAVSKYNHILTSDADCEFDNNWLKTCNYLINKEDADLYVLPVYLKGNSSFLSRFQFYDSLSSSAFNFGYSWFKKTALLASGANLLYKKESYLNHLPYQNNEHISSGDDMFLLQAFKKRGSKIVLCATKGAWVSSEVEESWFTLLKQRVRWTKKMRSLKGENSFILGLYIFIIQMGLLLLLFLSIYGILNISIFLIFLLAKFVVDYRLIASFAQLNDLNTNKMEVFVFEFVYLLFVPLLVIMAIFINPRWKGRIIES